MRWLLPFTLVLVGCVASVPVDPGITADLAVETARAVMQLRKVALPDSTPRPGDRCPNCDGRGYVGDGTIKTKCQPCGGDGVVK
jgi:hypothetical protein